MFTLFLGLVGMKLQKSLGTLGWRFKKGR